ncbi:DUF1127 domain-containing protein [Phreatobacter sp. AB_2022a]|uniref:DUF1127 domain-containing protein n=1 Tax=Phreatobacter sp. AB_2022a TaxID=3003134 RepID=UPI002286F15C|nr:DUF1127 domain-containing protein [Phreatobacter sp. AB_2022a]MCZ0737525.1 DUF1127 domain-containing protein [Phreatobacter sp. AB_2022a]
MALAIATFTAGFTVLAARTAQALAAVRAWHRARSDYQALCELDDGALRDVGLSRGDLHAASAVDFFDDPTALLAARALERRSGRRVSGGDRSVAWPPPADRSRPADALDLRCGAS